MIVCGQVIRCTFKIIFTRRKIYIISSGRRFHNISSFECIMPLIADRCTNVWLKNCHLFGCSNEFCWENENENAEKQKQKKNEIFPKVRDADAESNGNLKWNMWNGTALQVRISWPFWICHHLCSNVSTPVGVIEEDDARFVCVISRKIYENPTMRSTVFFLVFAIFFFFLFQMQNASEQ